MGDANSALLISQSAGAISQGLGAFNQASAIRAQGEAQARALRANAELAALQSADAIKRAGRASQQQLQATRNLIGRQRAAFAGQGVEVNVGTPLDIQADTAALGALDALTLRQSGAREAFGFQFQAIGFREQARLTEIGATAARRATLLTGALNIARGAALTGAAFQATRVPTLTQDAQVDRNIASMITASRGIGGAR